MDAHHLELLDELGPDAGRLEATPDLSVKDARLLEDEDVLHDDDVALHALDLGGGRGSRSRGLLAWPVDMEPSWPVFMACSMSSASPPRHSPTMTRSGRMRSELRTSSRMGMAPLPSMFGGRDSRVTTCSWRSCSSAASSMGAMRSPVGRAPPIGLDSSTRRPMGALMRSMMRVTWSSFWKTTLFSSSLPERSM